MPSLNVSCFFSTVRAKERGIFGFLPPHGRELQVDEQFTCFGSIYEAIIPHGRDSARRSILAFEKAVNEGKLVIVRTPAPILEDRTTLEVKMLDLNGGVLGVTDPCWANPGSVVGDNIGGNPFDG